MEGNSGSRDNLRLICDLVIQGDLATANTIIAELGFTLQNHALSTVYDHRGEQYHIPAWLYSRPQNILTEEQARTAREAAQPHRGPVHDVSVVVRIGTTPGFLEQDLNMTFKSDTQIGAVKRAVHAALQSGEHDHVNDSSNEWKGKGLPPSRQRMMFQGKELVDVMHLQQIGMVQGGFLQVFARPA